MDFDIAHRSFEASLARAAEMGGADLIFTSPPYPTARPGQYGGDASHDFAWEDYQRLGDRVREALRPGGFCGIVIDGPVKFWRNVEVGSERSLIAFKLAIDWSERVGLRYVEHCAYIRDAAPGLFGHRWRSGWEPVHVMQRPGPAIGVDMGAMQVPARMAGKMHAASANIGRFGGRVEHVQPDDKRLTTALSLGYVNKGSVDQDHHAPFADWLADAFVACYSSAGGLVCDPFVGSGTTALSAVTAKRRFVGGDLGARERDGRRWADIVVERVRQATAQQELFA